MFAWRPARGEEWRPSADRVSHPLEPKLRSDLAFLSDDERGGRDIGTEGIEESARHIADSFAADGLDVTLLDGTPFQTFAIAVAPTIGPAESNRLAVRDSQDSDPSEWTLAELEHDFRPLAIGGSSEVAGDLVFVGYGITAPELAYDDYAGIEATGKVAIVVRKEPQADQPTSRFNGVANTPHAYFESKIRNAAAHGVVAVLLVNDDRSIQTEVAAVNKRIQEERRRLSELDRQLAELPPEATNSRLSLESRRQPLQDMIQRTVQQRAQAEGGLLKVVEAGMHPLESGLPVISVSRSTVDDWLRRDGGESLAAALRRIDRTGQPASRSLALEASLQTSLSGSTALSSNVLGLLEGKGDLAEETVIVGAHYDHVGMGGPGSLAPGTIAVHNGADDNASGTAALMACVSSIRQRLSQLEHHRRVLFIAFTGEERGLLGSEHYVTHPRFPLSTTVAMINLDMVGRLRNNDLTVYGTGSARGLDTLLEEANESIGFSLFKISSGYGPSDHQSFYTRQIPVLFFFTGLHTDYHRPSDDFEKINFNGLARVTDITSEVTIRLAAQSRRPVYASTSRDVAIRWQPTAYLGIQMRPDGDGADGVIVSGVTSDGPAGRHGLRQGDRLLRIDGTDLRSVGELTDWIAERSPGDRVTVELLRGENAMSIEVTLGERTKR